MQPRQNGERVIDVFQTHRRFTYADVTIAQDLVGDAE